MRPLVAVVIIFTAFQSLDCIPDLSNSRLNYFDVDLLRYVAESKSGNVMVSPASIKSTLAMLLEGAQGATAMEIQTALRLAPNRDDYTEQLSFFLKDLEVNTPGVSLQNANGLFVSKKLQLKRDFETMVKRNYFAEVNKVDFSNPPIAAANINGWVNNKTRGLIPFIIEPVHIDGLTELLVINALYFKGTWLNEFEPKLTHGDCFYKNGVCKTVTMMDLEATLNYAYIDDLRAHALELPYQGKRYSMVLIVPQDRDAGLALIRDLPYIGLLQICKMLYPTDVILTMPKFTVEFADDMVEILKNMRISTLFSPSANLSGIFEGPTSAHVNSIIHKVYMSVDEKGTVAAAASAGMIVPLIADNVQLRIDRPFLFFIWDNEKGAVLFEGKVEEPAEFVAVRDNYGQNTVRPLPIPIASIDLYPKLPISNPYPVNQQGSIQPIVSQPVNSQPNVQYQPANQNVQPINQPFPLTNQPITEYPTTVNPPQSPANNPSRKSDSSSSWYKKVVDYFGG